MAQQRLFFDDIYDAANTALVECGKQKKQVAMEMRPDLKSESAKAWLSNCLMPDKPDKFSFEQLILFINLTKRPDGHCAFIDGLLDEAGQKRTEPRSPRNEAEELKRALLRNIEENKRILDQFERMESYLNK